MKEFFFDTADTEFIRNTWKKIENRVDKKLVRGITTNPNAFFKMGKFRLTEWLNSIPELCKVVSEIRGDSEGIVYVQGPSSKMTPEELHAYAQMVLQHQSGGAYVGLKIPPYTRILRNSGSFSDMFLNVTGVADAGTALKCLTYPNVRYVSIIPGRMEEAGIDSVKHLSFVNQRCPAKNERYEYRREIISGSMRTMEGLISTFKYGTVPTIGERVWNLILEEDNLQKLLDIDYSEAQSDVTAEFCPPFTEVSTNLSVSFFEQMDKCGEQAYADFCEASMVAKTCFPKWYKTFEEGFPIGNRQNNSIL